MAVNRVVHLATVELGKHLALPVLDLPVVIIRIVVDYRALLHADLPAGRVDDEQPRVRGVALQRVAQRHAVVWRTSHRIAHSRPGGGELGDGAAHLRSDADGSGSGDGPAVPVTRHVVDFRRTLVEQISPQVSAAGRPGEAHPKQGGMLRRGQVSQSVAVRVCEEHPQRSLARLFVVGNGADGERAAIERHACGRRRAVGSTLANVRPGTLALQPCDRSHLRLVHRACRQARQVDRRRCRGQHAGLLVIGVGVLVQRPGVGGLALRNLNAVLDLVSGDGHTVGRRRRPRHVQGRGRLLAELRAGEGRRSRLPSLEVRYVDGQAGGSGLALDGVGHLPRVGALGLVVKAGARGHPDVSVVGRDDEGVRRVTGQRVSPICIALVGPLGADGGAHRTSGA